MFSKNRVKDLEPNTAVFRVCLWGEVGSWKTWFYQQFRPLMGLSFNELARKDFVIGANSIFASWPLWGDTFLPTHAPCHGVCLATSLKAKEPTSHGLKLWAKMSLSSFKLTFSSTVSQRQQANQHSLHPWFSRTYPLGLSVQHLLPESQVKQLFPHLLDRLLIQ